MSLREAIQYSLMILLYLFLQIFFMRNIVMFNYAFCFIYIAGVLLLPADIDRMYLLLIAFGIGFTVDVFSNTFGMHASASVMIAYVRPFLIHYQMKSRGAERAEVGLRAQGLGAFLAYILPLILLHHAMLFFMEMNNFGMILYTLIRIGASALFTALLIILLELFSKR
ncbi:SoxR reducing system RseC family protein [Dyadobacter pollutisoli]|uniref:SoxR reducing system RseC family protein n=1 Tax=Dyadobacter pollutisoli TaxID=2910158 RepID=A0A9E8N717_9BACT|nr:SoxR reducing system RseC family protein [Dyadobacter pollutisoli]WAC11029.1 SoxR reducing system RseC family protein [Dyadobacter pollutisoli]